MSVIDSTSQATAVGVGAKNTPFSISGANLTSKIGIIATYDPAILTVTDEKEQLIISPEDAGSRYGFGYPLHRLALKVFAGSGGAGEVYAIPQAETGTAADGEIAWTIAVAITAAATINLRIGGDLYQIPIPNASTLEEVSDLVLAAVNADANATVIATKTAVTFETILTSKAKGLEGNNITIGLSGGNDEALPTGLTAVITDMANGAGTPTIQDALDGTGTGDDSNGNFLTHVVHGYGLDTTTLDAISTYVGEGDNFTGCYSKLVGRPFMSLNGDIDPGSAALTALIAISDVRLEDRANGVLGCPDSADIPTEIAALAIGYIAAIAQANPAQSYQGITLSGVDAGDSADRWTKEYSARDTAVKSGISPTRAIAGSLKLQNIITFYRPASIPTGSNGYKSFRSLSIIQNVLAKLREIFEAEDWQGISIVDNSADVTDFEAKQKVRDLTDVKTTLDNLTDFFVGKLWFFDDDFSKKNSEVSIRALSNGFDINYKWRMSGEAQIYNVQTTFDTNISG